MITKNLNKGDALQLLAKITKQTVFNNELNKAIRKAVKINPDLLIVEEINEKGESVKRKINGFWDKSTPQTRERMSDYLDENGARMSEQMKRAYIGTSASIFAGVYSIATNTPLLRDKKDLEEYIKMLDINETKDDSEEIEGATITRENGRLNVDFGGRVSNEIYKIMRSNGFLYSPKYEQFTRQATPNAEQSLKRVIKALKELKEEDDKKC